MIFVLNMCFLQHVLLSLLFVGLGLMFMLFLYFVLGGETSISDRPLSVPSSRQTIEQNCFLPQRSTDPAERFGVSESRVLSARVRTLEVSRTSLLRSTGAEAPLRLHEPRFQGPSASLTIAQQKNDDMDCLSQTRSVWDCHIYIDPLKPPLA